MQDNIEKTISKINAIFNKDYIGRGSLFGTSHVVISFFMTGACCIMLIY